MLNKVLTKLAEQKEEGTKLELLAPYVGLTIPTIAGMGAADYFRDNLDRLDPESDRVIDVLKRFVESKGGVFDKNNPKFEEGGAAFYDKGILGKPRVTIGSKTGKNIAAHEVGHFINTKDRLSRLNAKLYGLGKLTPLVSTIASTGILYSDLSPEDKEKYLYGTAGVGGLTTLPMLIEEGSASLRAKKMVDKLVKGKGRVPRTLFPGFLSYLGLASGAGAAPL